jgi:hypothetical protein
MGGSAIPSPSDRGDQEGGRIAVIMTAFTPYASAEFRVAALRN